MFADWREEAPLLPSPPLSPPPAGFERPRRREAIPAIQVSCGVAVAVGVVVLISFLFFFPIEEKTSLIIINVCCVVFFSLAPKKRRIHPRERNVRDQRHFVAETYLRDGHRGWRRAWGEHSHFCGELSTSKRRMMCSIEIFVPTRH